VVLSVADTGCGMDRQVLPHIFEPFFTTKEADNGTGLGLATVYGIVQQHQGLISLASRVGQGTTFELYFPAIPSSTESQLIPADAPFVSGNETILLAEDDESLRTLVVRILQDVGYQVLAATDGEEAAQIIEQNLSRIDLVILDVVMPKLNGRQLYEQVRTKDIRKPIIFCSGYSLRDLSSGWEALREKGRRTSGTTMVS
jgi:CheY-like chemotaxis protein